MSGLTFAQPAWFWGLLVLLPLAALRAWRTGMLLGDSPA